NSNQESAVPPRKKQPTEAGAPLATGRKKTTTKKAAAKPAPKATTAKRRSPALGDGNGKGKHDLVIVESPTKAKTINKYLGTTFRGLASLGHVRDLPKRRRPGEVIAGVSIDEGWLPSYVVIDDKHKKLLGEIRREAARANRIFLATDPDREGEAIAWHL